MLLLFKDGGGGQPVINNIKVFYINAEVRSPTIEQEERILTVTQEVRINNVQGN